MALDLFHLHLPDISNLPPALFWITRLDPSSIVFLLKGKGMFLKSCATALISIVLLAGCASTDLLADSSSKLGVQTAPNMVDSGVVLLPVTDRALFTSTGVSFVVSDEAGKEHSLVVDLLSRPIPATEGKGMRYYGAFNLPVGKYKFASWRFINTEGGAAEKPKEMMSFDVTEGEVIYLGNFNAIRPLAVGQFRQSFEADNQKYKELFPWMKDKEVKNQPMKSAWWPLPDGVIPK